jgi:hypothetical protein
MHRRYNRRWGCLEQPDLYDGSYSLSNPQSFNRYAYVQNDPVNFVDPSGLDPDDPPDPWDPSDIIRIFTRDSRPGGSLGGGAFGIDMPLAEVGVEGGGGGGGIHEGGHTPQDTSQQNPYPGCITANWFVNTPQVKAVFDDYWRRTQSSGKENGGWFFFEPKTNTLIGKSASEGEKSWMPNEQREFDAQMSQFRQSGQSVILMFDFHTHPAGSGPSGGDMGNINNVSKRMASIGAQGGGHAPIGIIIHGPGKITLYDRNGLVNKFNRLNECL